MLDRAAVGIEKTGEQTRYARHFAREMATFRRFRREEFESAGNVVAARAGHRVEDDRRLLPLELVDGADPDPPVGDVLAQAADVSRR